MSIVVTLALFVGMCCALPGAVVCFQGEDGDGAIGAQ